MVLSSNTAVFVHLEKAFGLQDGPSRRLRHPGDTGKKRGTEMVPMSGAVESRKLSRELREAALKELKVAGLGRMKFILRENTCPANMLEDLPSNISVFP